ncbi:MAG TPA: VOC family protein [Dehalococcoidia bacterium]|nr:VOC family protein [Dehalococcoidia bacterium]
MFKRIDHVEMITSDFQGTIDFYTDVLGFRHHHTLQIPDRPVEVAYLTLNNASIEVINYRDGSAAPAPPPEHLGYRMMALEVEDMDKAIAHLQAHGVEVHMPPRLYDKFSRAEIKDPNGFRIELRQWFEPPL